MYLPCFFILIAYLQNTPPRPPTTSGPTSSSSGPIRPYTTSTVLIQFNRYYVLCTRAGLPPPTPIGRFLHIQRIKKIKQISLSLHISHLKHTHHTHTTHTPHTIRTPHAHTYTPHHAHHTPHLHLSGTGACTPILKFHAVQRPFASKITEEMGDDYID